MSYTMDTIFVDAYNAMLHHLADQNGSKLKGIFMEETAKGDLHFFDRIGNSTVSEITEVGSDIVHQNSEFTRRGAVLKGYDTSELVFDIDKLKMLVDPTNDIVRKITNAMDRNFDRTIINAILGDAIVGHVGGSTQGFDTSNQQVAHGGTGLSPAKIAEALKKFELADVDTDRSDLFLLVDPRGKEDFMAIASLTSVDYQNSKILTGKQMPSYRGINMISTNQMPAHTTGSVYRALLVTGDAVKIARGMNKKLDITVRKDLRDQPVQIYAKEYFGAVRIEESLCVDILFQ